MNVCQDDWMRRFRTSVAQTLTRAVRWSISGEPLSTTRCVVVVAPHTSKWDLPVMILVANALFPRALWMAKHTLFLFPLGRVMNMAGGMAIERDKDNGLVDRLVDAFATREPLALLIAPEATRSRVEYWTSGFYHIARRAQVPVVPLYLDYAQRTADMGAPLWPTGDVKADMDRIRAFFADRPVKVPERFAEPRLRSESEER